MKCFIAMTFRRSFQSTKRSNSRKLSAAPSPGRFVNGILDRVKDDLRRPLREAIKKEEAK